LERRAGARHEALSRQSLDDAAARRSARIKRFRPAQNDLLSGLLDKNSVTAKALDAETVGRLPAFMPFS